MDEATLETWRSCVRSRIGITRWSADGSRSVELVHPGITFVIAKDERRRNQATIADKKRDPFTNGSFALVDAQDLDAETVALAGNPNVKTDEELLGILEAGSFEDFEASLDAVDSMALAYRIYGVARDNHTAGKRLELVRAMVKRLDPSSVLVGDVIITGNEVAPADNPRQPAVAGIPQG